MQTQKSQNPTWNETSHHHRQGPCRDQRRKRGRIGYRQVSCAPVDATSGFFYKKRERKRERETSERSNLQTYPYRRKGELKSGQAAHELRESCLGKIPPVY